MVCILKISLLTWGLLAWTMDTKHARFWVETPLPNGNTTVTFVDRFHLLSPGKTKHTRVILEDKKLQTRFQKAYNEPVYKIASFVNNFRININPLNAEDASCLTTSWIWTFGTWQLGAEDPCVWDFPADGCQTKDGLLKIRACWRRFSIMKLCHWHLGFPIGFLL